MKDDIRTTREWKEVPIKDMTDSHLINTIKFCRKRADEWRLVAYDYYEADLICWAEALELVPQYGNLLREARKRKLEFTL